jgi:hypothetical protein
VVPKVTLASADPGILFSPQPTYAANDAAAPNMIEAKAPPAAAPPPKVAVASLMPKPKPKPRSNAVLNDSQLTSIKRRLNLTPEQERYWPAIEAELRKMEYTKSQGGTRTASIDMSKVNVEGLKSAGFPLVMSFSDDQRRELKSRPAFAPGFFFAARSRVPTSRVPTVSTAPQSTLDFVRRQPNGRRVWT